MKTRADTFYVVAGEVADTLKYLDFDMSSGGYPYANGAPRCMTTELSKAISWRNDARANFKALDNPKVYKIVLEKVDTREFENEIQQVEDFFEGLTEMQKAVLKSKLVRG